MAGDVIVLFKPYMYRKDIFDVDYHKLKQDGVKCIVFDLDNTLSFVSENKCSMKVKKLLMRLKKDFFICISSNSTKKRIIPYLDDLDIDGISFSLKPLPKALIKIRKRYGFSKDEMVMIGDQLLTDVLAGNSYGIRPFWLILWVK